MAEKYVDTTLTEDSTIYEVAPTTNYGTETTIKVVSLATNQDGRAIIKLGMPDKPAWADGDPTSVRLRLYMSAQAGSTLRAYRFYRTDQTGIIETSVTWNTINGVDAWTAAGGDLDALVYSEAYLGYTTGQWYEFDITVMDLGWGASAWIIIKDQNEEAGSEQSRTFHSAEGTNKPILRVYAVDKTPTPIKDLKLIANEADATKVKLTWSANEDSDFARYEIRKSTTSPVTYASTLVATITDQAATEYTEAAANTENVVYYYAIFVEDASNVDADGAKSNEVFAIRPRVESFYPDDFTPDLFQKVMFYGYGYTIAATPSPVANTLVVIEFG
ncbi:MAG TPA: DNRLRE domain-containing protein, partial [Thermoplasmata archaeon]